MSKAPEQEVKSAKIQAKANTSDNKAKADKKKGSDKKALDKKTSKIDQLIEYFNLSKLELRKVSWPTYKETKTTTLVVFAFVSVMAILLGLVDLALSSIIGLILS